MGNQCCLEEDQVVICDKSAVKPLMTRWCCPWTIWA